MSRILVVDDEENVREALKRRLEREGYEVDLASGEREAMEAAAKSNLSYDVIVTDMLMETADSGLEVLKVATARDAFTEVIVLTAYGNIANAVECMRRGAFDYVEKNIPGVDVFELLTIKINQALERRGVAMSAFKTMQESALGIPWVEEAAKAWAKMTGKLPDFDFKAKPPSDKERQVH